jgi:tRNA (mo5U34)-methyltransferase
VFPPQPDALRDEIIRLGPWHFDVQVTRELSTGISRGVEYPKAFGPVALQDVHGEFLTRLRAIYPDGLAGRTMLDCACNCGAYLFWGKELGAGKCFGSDVREHWIRQARFLLEHRTEGPTADMRFEVCDLYDLPALGLEPVDIMFHTGVFYHLPDPITGLKVAADLTRELLIFDTATRSKEADGRLVVEWEPTAEVMSGVHGLNWLPTGPQVLAQIMAWAGFRELRLLRWTEEAFRGRDGGPGRGRIVMAASKVPGLLEGTLGTPVELDIPARSHPK